MRMSGGSSQSEQHQQDARDVGEAIVLVGHTRISSKLRESYSTSSMFGRVQGRDISTFRIFEARFRVIRP